jgi:hypothetical protein
VQVRFAAARHLNFGFKKKIELPRERTLRAPGAAGRGLDAT